MSQPIDELATETAPDPHPRWPRWLRRGPLELVAAGVIALGMPADLVLLSGLPAPDTPDPRVWWTIRGGNVLSVSADAPPAA